MGWLAGVLSGYSDRQGEIRQENSRLAEEAAQREGKIYEALLNSPDEKIQGMAATGLLQMGQPRKSKSGFAGWMGEMQSSPIYPTLMKYITTPQREEKVTGLPSTQMTGFSTLPVGGTSGHQSEQFDYPVPTSATQLPGAETTETDPNLAQTATSPTTGGAMATPETHPASAAASPAGPPAPPPNVAAAAAPLASHALAQATPPPAPPPGLSSASAQPGLQVGLPPSTSTYTTRSLPAPTEVSYHLPHAFPTAEETASHAALAKQKADIQADAWMYQQAHPEWTPQQSFEAAAKLAESHAHAAGGLATTYIKGGIVPDPGSPTGFSRQWVLRSDPTRHQLLPEQPPNTPELQEYQKTVARRIGTIAQTPEEAMKEARARFPQETEEQQAVQAQAIWEFSQQMMEAQRRTIPGVGQVRSGVGAPPPTLGAPPQPGAPGAAPGGAAPAPGAAAPAVVAPATVTEADPSGLPPPAAAPNAAAPNAAPAAGGPPTFAQSIAPGFQDVSPRTNKPLSAAPQQAVNEARATEALVDRALASLAPHKDKNDEVDGLDMALNYKKGLLDAQGAVAQIANLAALQSSATKALSAGGSRSYQFIQDKQQHVPRLPSDEQIAKYELATQYLGMDAKDAARWVSLYYRNQNKPVWDSPQIMIEKLQAVRKNLDDYIADAMNIDVPEPGPGGARPRANPNAVPVQPPPQPPPSVTGASTAAPPAARGRIDVNSDIVYGPNGPTVVAR